MKIGIFSLPYNDIPFGEFLDFARGFGYETVEISAHKDSRHIDINNVLAGGAKKIKNEVAVIDESLCEECGVCVDECPEEAIELPEE